MSETRTDLVCPNTERKPPPQLVPSPQIYDLTERCWVCGERLVIGMVEVEREEE